jgi:hypothetical protein
LAVSRSGVGNLGRVIDALLNLFVQSSLFMTQAQSLLGLAAVVLGGVLASYATWHLTDRLIAWQQNAD